MPLTQSETLLEAQKLAEKLRGFVRCYPLNLDPQTSITVTRFTLRNADFKRR